MKSKEVARVKDKQLLNFAFMLTANHTPFLSLCSMAVKVLQQPIRLRDILKPFMLFLIRKHTQIKRTLNNRRATYIIKMILSCYLIMNLDFLSLILSLHTKRALTSVTREPEALVLQEI